MENIKYKIKENENENKNNNLHSSTELFVKELIQNMHKECPDELIQDDKTKDDYGLSEIGIIVKDIRNNLTKDMKITIQKAHRNKSGKLISYVTGIEYEDETVLEFSHKVAIGLGKYIFPESTDCVENIVLVERVLNRTMGQMSVEQFKKEYNQNKKAFTQLLKAA